VTYSNNRIFAVATYMDAAGDAHCPSTISTTPPPAPQPGKPWSTNRLTVDCAGQFRLCYNLRASHAPYSTGGSVPPQDLWDEQPGISFRERERLFDDLGCDRAWEYAREHPGRELELAPKKVGWLLRSDAADAIAWSESLGSTPLHRGDADVWGFIGDAIWYPMLALALLSAAVLPRSRELAALWLALVVWTALHVVFHGEPRYHVPVVPLLCALAAASVIYLADSAFVVSARRR
jgi:hypothetical protein